MNNKKILYFIVAKSGCGKDYIINKICNKFNKKKVISATSQKKENHTDQNTKQIECFALDILFLHDQSTEQESNQDTPPSNHRNKGNHSILLT